MRLFLAVNFDRRTKGEILAVQQRLRALGQGNFSRPENLHLTLAFLGEVAPRRVDAVRQAMEQTELRPFELTFDRVGFFPGRDGVLWWIGCAKNSALIGLQAELSQRLSAAGFSLEQRRFSPHITLARNVRLVEQPNSRTLLRESFSAEVRTVSLMLSERVDGSLIYTELFSAAGKDTKSGDRETGSV